MAPISPRVLEIERHRLSQGRHPAVGQPLHMQRHDGGPLEEVVTALTEAHSTLEATHPLAGYALHCDLALVAMLYKRSGQSAGSGPRTLWSPMCPQPLGHCGALVHAAPWRSCAAG